MPAPKPRNYSNLEPDVRPEPDDYYTIVTKRYGPDGGITSQTYYHMGSDLVHEIRISSTDTNIEIHKKSVSGRVQVTTIPLTEVIRVDYNDCSPEFYAAANVWTQHTTGLSFKEYIEMQKKSATVTREDRIKSIFSERFGVPKEGVVLESEIFGNEEEDDGSPQ
jgi:hypothetical protein